MQSADYKMKKIRIPIVAIVMIAFLGVGIVFGISLRNKFERTAGRLLPNDVYATETAKVKDDNTPIMGGHSSANYFEAVLQLVSDEYVDPVKEPKKLAHGAIRFMLQRLDDAGSRFYDEKEWSAYLGMFEGRYQGIGADLIIKRIGTKGKYEFPLVVASVADGGPAAKAGLKAGDIIDEIDGRWIASRSLLVDLDAKNLELQAKKISNEQFDLFLKNLRKRAETLLPVYKAMTKLIAENGTSVKCKVIRNGLSIDMELPRTGANVETIEEKAGVIRIRTFGSQVDEKLKEMIADKSNIKIDLRGNPGGSWEIMKKSVELFVSGKEWIGIKSEPDSSIKKLISNSKLSKNVELELLVDSGTAREAEVFAIALRDGAGAKIVGGPTMGMGLQTKRFGLQDGSGYTLTSGRVFDIKGNPLFKEDVILSGLINAEENQQ